MNSIIFSKITALLVSAVVFLATRGAYAQNVKSELVSSRTKLEFIPEKAYINIQNADQTVLQYQALIIPPLKKSESDFSQDEWVIGTLISSSQSNPAVSYSVFLKGKADENLFIPWQSIETAVNSANLNSLDLIKQQIGIRKQILESLQVQYNTQAASLKRLRADAEVIANLGRIVEVVDETELVKSEIENLDKDLELLRSTFQAVKGMTTPKNYLRRELELTRQSDDLLKLVKTAESTEESRTKLSQEEIQAKLALIEETRYEDEDKLKTELIRLKTHSAGTKSGTLQDGTGQNGTVNNGTNGNQQNTQPTAEPVKNYWDIQ